MTALRKFRQQTAPPGRRAVLKVGSSLLAADRGGLSTRHALGLAQFIASCQAPGHDARSDPDARPIDEVRELTAEIMGMAGAAGSLVGTGGMRTKREAAEKAAAGSQTILFNGREGEVVNLLSRDLLHGSLLRTSATRLQARKYRLLHQPAERGCIHVDAGAARALSEGGVSLLPRGVIDAVGEFRRGDMVEIMGDSPDGEAYVVARGITQYSAAEINQLARSHSRDITQRLGYCYGEHFVHRDYLVLPTEVGVTP